MEGSSLTNEDLEAALQLIQLISSGCSPRDETIGKFKQGAGEQSEDDGTSTAPAYGERKSRSPGERKRKLLLSSRARIRRRIHKEMKAAEQLLHLSEEEGEGEGEGGESGSNISEASYVTDASSAVAMESRADRERESEAKRGGSKSDRRGLCRANYLEEGKGDVMEEEQCLADVFCIERKRKYRSLIDIYTDGPRISSKIA